MITMPGNQYANATHRQPSGPIADAMLALAFEQRTANLIAYAADVDVIRDDERLNAAIRDRLGMGDDDE